MCGFGTSQSAPTTQLSTQSTQADPRAAAMYSSAWNNAQIAAQRPFTPYSNDPNAFVAPMNSTQLSAVNDIYGMQNAGNPYYQAAPGMAYASGNTSAAGLAPSYMSPYLDSVAAATMGILGQQQGQQQNQLSGDIAKNGQWGNSRSGVERALLSGQQNLATANTISNLYNTGYNSALGAAQTDLQRQLAAAQGLGTAGQTGAQNLLGAGTVGQQTQQAGLGALYNQFLMQQQYPFQVAQFLSSTAAGLGPGYGSTTSGYQNSQQPLSFFGNPLSDPSLKVGAEGDEPEIIGETHDGQEIYRYRLINPDTGEVGPVQIGLMADEVQKRRPDAIGDYKGFKTVDYAKATDGAARIGGLGRDDYAAGGSIEDLLREHQAMYSGLGRPQGGLVPQSQMPTAKIDAPVLQYQHLQKTQPYGLGQLAKDALGVAESGKGLYSEGKGLYDWMTTPSSDSTMAADNYASGGLVYDAHPDLTEGPEDWKMPVAKLNAPELSFGSSGQGQSGGGLGDMVKGAAGLAGAAKTLWDVGSTVGPALMAALPFSDRRLKTGVSGYDSGGRVGYATTGGVDPSNFDDAVKDTFRFEGGLNPRDTNGTPSNYGINQKANPDTDVRNLTPERAKDLYRDRYWNAIDADKLPRGLANVAYDTAVMSGPGRAKEFLAQSGGDPEKFMELRENFLHGLIEKNPAKYGKYGPAWDNRNQSLRAGLDGGPAMAFAPAEDRPANAGLAAMPPQSSDGLAPARGGLAPALATAGEDSAPAQGVSGMIRGTPASGLGERALDFATSERFLVPLLTGLGAMASSGSRYLAPAALQGLGAGAKSYIEVPKSQAETAKIAEEAKVQAAEAAAKRQLVPKIGVETKRLQSELYDRQWVPNVGWMVYDRTNPYSTPVRISDVNGNPLPGSESYRGIPAAPATAEGPQKPPAPLSAAPPAQTPTSPKPPGAGIGDALDWKATVAAPNGVEIPGALNSALSGDIKNQQETAQREIEDQGKRAKAAYDQQYRLREMERQISNLTKDGGFLLPGTNADMRLEVAKAANTFSTMFGGGPIFDPNNVAAGENLAKDSTQLGFATARQLGHEPGFIVSQSIKANPSMENSPMAFKRIVAGLREAANYEQDRLQFLESYRGKYQTTAGADALFRKLNPPEAYARRAILSTIDEEDLRHLREMPKDKLLSRKKKIDKEYGEGTTNLLAGGE